MKIVAQCIQIAQAQSTNNQTASFLKKQANRFLQFWLEPFPPHVWHRPVIRDHLRAYADKPLFTG